MTFAKWTIVLLTVFLSFTLRAQKSSGPQPNSGAGQHATKVQSTNDSQRSPEDTVGVQDAAANEKLQSAGAPGAAKAATPGSNTTHAQNASGSAASNVPAVPQTVSSGSGSPAVLSNDDGGERDGTNNVQRATMNMAGAPATNLNLDNIQSEGSDAEMKDRQDYSRDKEASARKQAGQTPENTSEGSAEINKNNRRENNDLSDQNLSSKERKPSARKNGPGSSGKSRKKTKG